MVKGLLSTLAIGAFALSANAFDFTSYQKYFEKDDYREALNMGLKFFGGQRCGNTHNWMLHDNPNVTNKFCHTQDGKGSVNGGANGNYDLTGGWHDCGDHIKVGTTMGYAAVSLLVAYDVWPNAFQDNYDENYGAPNGIPDVLDEAKIATDYFMKSFISNTEFAYYVGSGGDHNVWVTSSAQSDMPIDRGGDPRPVWIETQKGGPQAANYISALCLMAMHYPDNAYKLKCREAAIAAYPFAKQHKEAHAAIPQFYSNPNTEWTDELSLAAIMLYRLTGDETYWTDVTTFLYNKYESNSPLAWDTMSDFVYYYIGTIKPTQSNGAGGTLANFLSVNLFSSSGNHMQKAESNPNGFPYYSSTWGTNKLALGAAVCAALYVKLAEDGKINEPEERVIKAQNFVYRIVDYVLGNNEFGHTFLHGFKGDMTFRIHHRNAMGRNDNPVESIKNTCEYMFASGGLIGGPSGTGQFSNIVEGGSYYTETEGGCDYNAPFVVAIASVMSQLEPTTDADDNLANKESLFSVYPAVISDYVIIDPISIGFSSEAKVSVMSADGQTLRRETMRSYSPLIISTSDLAQGIYIVSITYDGGQYTTKVVKK